MPRAVPPGLALVVGEPVLMITDLIKLWWCDGGCLLETGGWEQRPPRSPFNETSSISLANEKIEVI